MRLRYLEYLHLLTVIAICSWLRDGEVWKLTIAWTFWGLHTEQWSKMLTNKLQRALKQITTGKVTWVRKQISKEVALNLLRLAKKSQNKHNLLSTNHDWANPKQIVTCFGIRTRVSSRAFSSRVQTCPISFFPSCVTGQGCVFLVRSRSDWFITFGVCFCGWSAVIIIWFSFMLDVWNPL